MTSVDCTEVAAPTETDPKASFVQLTVGLKIKSCRLNREDCRVSFKQYWWNFGSKMYAKTGFLR